MEAKLRHPQVHRYGEDHHHHQHINMEGREGEQHDGENKSILKKVKAKAKKLKESIKKHGHIHGHDHDQYDCAGQQEQEHLESDEEDGDDDSEDSEVGVPQQGYGTGGFDEPSRSSGRLIIPEEDPVAPRNTPISHGEEAHEPEQNQSGYIGKASSAASLFASKAICAKNAVASKLGYTNSSTTLGAKLQPGEEDKALSELISSTLCKKGRSAEAGAVNKDQEKRAVRERVSDAVHKRASGHDDGDGDRDTKDHREVKLMGRVMESDEVARRFGSSEEEKRGEVTSVPGDGSPSKPVADMIKAALGSWWTGGQQQQQPGQNGQSGN